METPAVTAARGFAVSPRLYERLAVGVAAMLVVIVVTGATVRLTASGLGCEHWPGCQPGQPFPEKGFHSYVEFSNRLIAFVTIVATLAVGMKLALIAIQPRLAASLTKNG